MSLTRVYAGSGDVGSGSSGTLTLEDLPVGTAAPERAVVLAVQASFSTDPSAVAFTLGGETCSIDAVEDAGGSLFQYILSVDLPTGTLADLVCTATGANVTDLVAGAWAVSGPVFATDTAGGTVASPTALSIDRVAGGVTFASAFGSDEHDWAYPTEDEEIFDDAYSVASAEVAMSGTGTITISGPSFVTVVAVHYSDPPVPVDAEADIALDDVSSYATNAPLTTSVAITLDDIGSTAYGESESPADYFTRVLLDRESGETIIILATITHPSLESPARLALNTPGHDIVSNGQTFTATYFDVVLVSDNDGPPVAKIRVPNVNREIGALLDGIDEPPVVRFDVVLASNPNQIERSFTQLKLMSASWDASMVEGELGQTDFANTPYPAMAAIPAYFPALFK